MRYDDGHSTVRAPDDEAMARSVVRSVSEVEWTGALILLGIAALAIGVPLVRGVLRGHPLLGLANAILLGFAGLGLLFLINLLVLIPVTVVRYGRAAKTLAHRLALDNPAPALHRSWSDRTPGAITVAADGRAWLADRSTAYRPLALAPCDILSAETISIERRTRVRFRGPAIGIGVPIGGGLMMTVPVGGKDRPVPIRVRHAVSLVYRVSGREQVTIIPFAGDQTGARVMTAMLGRTVASV